ncbi:MAG TPA: FtsX-like permease family protein [Solirubrobacteraceae bacterium]
MSVSARLALAGARRSPWQTLIRILVLSAAAALLGAMLLFVGNSLQTMGASAVRSVPLDWQGPVSSYRADLRVAGAVGRLPGIQQASATATAPLADAAHTGPAGLTNTGAGAVLAVPPGYDTHLHTYRVLQGGFAPGGVVLDQQMASTLQARLGDFVTLRSRPHAKPERFRVTGVALVTHPDVLFQPLNPQLGPAAAQPPANIALMPLTTFAARYAATLRTLTAANVGSSAVPGAQDGVQWEVQAQLDPRSLSGSPATALARATQARNRVQRVLTGQIQFVDNLGDKLNTAAGDALYAEALYIMLALPGALIALGLVYLAGLGSAERDRRDVALLLARGGRRRDVISLALFDSFLVGVGAGLLGTALAVLAGNALVTGGVQLTPGRVLATGAVCLALAVLGAAAARVTTAVRTLKTSIVDARRGVQRERSPLWRRIGLDFIALILSGLIYWLTASTGFSAVVSPDSNPTLSLAVYMFFAPALLWIGITLLLVRLRGRMVGWLARVLTGRRATSWRALLLASAGRRGAAINRGLVLVGLLLAFGVSLGVFTATYDQQVTVDAQLTLGGDVTVTAPPGRVQQAGLAQAVARVPGVQSATAVDHSYAYVGPDLQDTYGVSPVTLGHATTLRDSYFLGGTAAQIMQRLRNRPDGILVSKETITDYSLNLGDLLKLRVLDRRTGGFKTVSFHVMGVVQEFPSAPKDSFMVANLNYLEAHDHGPGPNVIFAKAGSDPAGIAARVSAATRRYGTTVSNIAQQSVQTGSAITTVDLSGVRDIEEVFAIGLAAAAMALFVALAMSERRQEFATMAAVGAPLRRIGAFLWSEAALVLALSIVLAIGLGFALSEMLIAMLQHVFDPPPDHLAIPWGYLGGLFGAAIGASAIAVAVAARTLARLRLGEVLREP